MWPMRSPSRRLISLLIAIAALACVACLGLRSRAASNQQLDLLILHGKLVDGSGKKPRNADVGIRGDRIAFVGDAHKANLTAARIVDATGLVVAPGFIDPHTHTLGDLSEEKRKGNEEMKIMASGHAVTPNGRYPSVMLLFLFA